MPSSSMLQVRWLRSGSRGARIWCDGLTPTLVSELDQHLSPLLSPAGVPDFVAWIAHTPGGGFTLDGRPSPLFLRLRGLTLESIAREIFLRLDVHLLPGAVLRNGEHVVWLLGDEGDDVGRALATPATRLFWDAGSGRLISGTEIISGGDVFHMTRLAADRPSASGHRTSLAARDAGETCAALRRAGVAIQPALREALGAWTHHRLLYAQASAAAAAVRAAARPASSTPRPSAPTPRTIWLRMGGAAVEVAALVPDEVWRDLEYMLEPLRGEAKPTRASVALGPWGDGWAVVRSVLSDYFRREAREPHALLSSVNRLLQAELPRLEPAHVVCLGTALVKDGTAVWLIGPPGSGKTTLGLMLVLERGFRVLSDDMVLVRDGGLDPYPKVMSLRAGAWDLFPRLRERGIWIRREGELLAGVLNLQRELGLPVPARHEGPVIVVRCRFDPAAETAVVLEPLEPEPTAALLETYARSGQDRAQLRHEVDALRPRLVGFDLRFRDGEGAVAAVEGLLSRRSYGSS